MKKVLCILLIACCLAAAFALTGCADTDDPDRLGLTPNFTAEQMTGLLEEFLTENPDRTARPKTEESAETGEYHAAEWLSAKLTDLMGGNGITEIRTSSNTRLSAQGGDDFTVRNVIARVSGGQNTGNRKVIIGTNYDNAYATVNVKGQSDYVYFNGTKAEGAMSSGTGVATLLALAGYFAANRDSLTVDVEFVFYGMSVYNGYGAYISAGEIKDPGVAMVFNVSRLGGDKLFAYFDETATAHGALIMDTAERLGYGDEISQPSAALTDVGGKSVDSLNYTPFALTSSVQPYFDKYNICAMTSAADTAFYLYDRERAGMDNVCGTNADTLANLQTHGADYAEQMAVAADVISQSVQAEGFLAACDESAASKGSYAWLSLPLVAFLTVIVLAAGVIAAAVIVSRKIAKSCKPSGGPKRNVKVAVFGMEYEEPKENDVYADPPPKKDDNPFDEDFL